MRETPKHKEAFRKYYNLGNSRTLASLADHFGITERTAKQWSREFHWQDRIAERDTSQESGANSNRMEQLEKQLAMIQERLSKLEDKFKAHQTWTGHRRV